MRTVRSRQVLVAVGVLWVMAGCHREGDALGKGNATRRSVGVESAAGGVVDSAQSGALTAVAAVLSSGNAFAIVDTSYSQMLAEDSLALARAKNPRVHAFAQRAVSQDALAKRGVHDVARQQNITAILGPNSQVKDNADALRSLRSTQGADFDKAYVDHAIELREDLLKTVNKALEARDREPPVRDFLSQMRQTLNGDRDTLQAIRKSL